MKNKLIMLQLFADSAGADGAEGQSGNQESQSGTQGASADAGKEGKEEPGQQLKYTDEDVNKLIERKFAEWQKKKQKEVDEAKRLAEMNAQEKAEYERDQFKKELDDLKKQASLTAMGKTARKMLSDQGINIPDELLAHLVHENADDTKTAVGTFAQLFKNAVQEEVKAKLKGTSHKSGSGSSEITKEQIMAIKNPVERQRLIAENLDLFE